MRPVVATLRGASGLTYKLRIGWFRVYTALKQNPRPPQRHAPRSPSGTILYEDFGATPLQVTSPLGGFLTTHRAIMERIAK